MPGIVLSAFYAVIHLILTITSEISTINIIILILKKEKLKYREVK